jgi:hypothetical protein
LADLLVKPRGGGQHAVVVQERANDGEEDDGNGAHAVNEGVLVNVFIVRDRPGIIVIQGVAIALVQPPAQENIPGNLPRGGTTALSAMVFNTRETHRCMPELPSAARAR